MGDYLEIRFHGRGGSGTWTAARLTALTAINEGKYAQCFPLFGPERSGAPLEAYVRIGDKPVIIHSMIYSPDVIVVLDKNLLPLSVEGLREGATIIINSDKKIHEALGKVKLKKGKIFYVSANEIALRFIGKSIVNTAMIGALLRVTKLAKLKTAEETLKGSFKGKLSAEDIEKNIEAMRGAYDEVRKIA